MRIIGLFKLLSAVGFLALAILGMNHLLNPQQHEALKTALETSRLDSENQFMHQMFEKMLAIPPETLKDLRLVLFFYAALHGVEGIGLICGQTWAEWLVVLNTGLFVPWEVYEIFHAFSWLRISALALNLAIMAYFIGRLVRQHKLHKLEHQGAPVPA
jgi:uncharacterized membrane protein (DUF2068 family)